MLTPQIFVCVDKMLLFFNLQESNYNTANVVILSL